jgi:hypothetical protein
MNFFYTFLLLLVVLSAYSESPQHGKPPDSLDLTVAAVCPNSSSNLLGVLAPVLLQTEVSGSVLSQNMVLPEVYRTVLPLNEVGSVLQNGVFQFILPQNEVFEVVLSHVEMNKTVLSQASIVTVKCQLFKNVKNSVNSLLNIGANITNFLTLVVKHIGGKLAWTIRILLESLQHVLKMYTWSLSENQASVQFKCRLIGLILKQSL